jgi:alpha/beta superfamily hydrolase
MKDATPPARPLFFEVGERPVYGVYHPAAAGRGTGTPILIHCHTLGVEQLTSNRTEALNARAASALGFPAFRFHSRGHGDSAGNFSEVTLDSLVDDACAAADQAMRLSGATRVVWLGLRFGAIVAAAALARRGDAAGLILWEPARRAEDYFRSMVRSMIFSQVSKGLKPKETVDQLLARVGEQGRVDVHGYYLHRAILESARSTDLMELVGGWSGPTLLVQIQDRRRLAPGHAKLVGALEGQGADVSVAQVEEEPGWHFVTNPAWEGSEVVRHSAEWLDALD